MVSFCSALLCTILYFTILHRTILYYTVLLCVVLIFIPCNRLYQRLQLFIICSTFLTLLALSSSLLHTIYIAAITARTVIGLYKLYITTLIENDCHCYHSTNRLCTMYSVLCTIYYVLCTMYYVPLL